MCVRGVCVLVRMCMCTCVRTCVWVSVYTHTHLNTMIHVAHYLPHYTNNMHTCIMYCITNAIHHNNKQYHNLTTSPYLHTHTSNYFDYTYTINTRVSNGIIIRIPISKHEPAYTIVIFRVRMRVYIHACMRVCACTCMRACVFA